MQAVARKTPPHGPARYRAWLTNLGLLGIGLGLVLLSRQLIREFDHFTLGLSGVAGWSLILYAAAVLLILTQPVNRATFGIILAVGIGCRLVTLFPPPYLSTDVYRYAWDGVVQHAGISPYRYVPGDPALAFLREPNQDLFDNINRRDYAHTIYPPGAQALFYLVTFFDPSMTCMKLAMILCEGATLWALFRLLQLQGIRRERLLLYAWCPLLIWEVGSSGHLDSAAMAAIALALLARYQRQSVACGAWLGLAVLIKLYPIVLLPALFRRGEFRMPAVLGGVVAFGYACYSGVGLRVLGFLGGYVQEEGINTGSRFFLLEQAQHLPGLARLPVLVYLLGCGAVFAALLAWCWRTCCRGVEVPATPAGAPWLAPPPSFLPAAYALSLALMLLFSPHYPWYVAWLVPFFTLMPGPVGFAYTGGLFYLCSTALAVGPGPKQFHLNQILYGWVLAAFCAGLVFRRWPVHRRLFAVERGRFA